MCFHHSQEIYFQNNALFLILNITSNYKLLKRTKCSSASSSCTSSSPPQIQLHRLLQAGDAGVQSCEAVPERRLVPGVEGRPGSQAAVGPQRLHVAVGQRGVQPPAARLCFTHTLGLVGVRGRSVGRFVRGASLSLHVLAGRGIKPAQRHQVLGDALVEGLVWCRQQGLDNCRTN